MKDKWAASWTLDPSVNYLNHGSFGACPHNVMQEQAVWRARMEQNPIQFFMRDLEPALDKARADLAAFLHCDAADLSFVTNATSGVNTILRSLSLTSGDEIIITNHGYNACSNAAYSVAAAHGCQVVMVAVPFPLAAADEVVTTILAHVTSRTKLLLIDHVTSPTALIFPVERLVRELAQRGVDTLVDGAHAPGMLPLDLDALGAAYYTGNCHKWLCAPKGAGFIHVRRDLRDKVHPLVISHGANSPRTDRAPFRLEFDWTGTQDFSPFLSIPTAIQLLGGMVAGGWDEIYRHNHAFAVEARQILAEALDLDLPCPTSMIGSMAALVLPKGALEHLFPDGFVDAANSTLSLVHRIEAPVFPWPIPPQCLLRVSGQLYNRTEQVHHLAQVLKQIFSK